VPVPPIVPPVIAIVLPKVNAAVPAIVAVPPVTVSVLMVSVVGVTRLNNPSEFTVTFAVFGIWLFAVNRSSAELAAPLESPTLIVVEPTALKPAVLENCTNPSFTLNAPVIVFAAPPLKVSVPPPVFVKVNAPPATTPLTTNVLPVLTFHTAFADGVTLDEIVWVPPPAESVIAPVLIVRVLFAIEKLVVVLIVNEFTTRLPFKLVFTPDPNPVPKTISSTGSGVL